MRRGGHLRTSPDMGVLGRTASRALVKCHRLRYPSCMPGSGHGPESIPAPEEWLHRAVQDTLPETHHEAPLKVPFCF